MNHAIEQHWNSEILFQLFSLEVLSKCPLIVFCRSSHHGNSLPWKLDVSINLTIWLQDWKISNFLAPFWASACWCKSQDFFLGSVSGFLHWTYQNSNCQWISQVLQWETRPLKCRVWGYPICLVFINWESWHLYALQSLQVHSCILLQAYQGETRALIDLVGEGCKCKRVMLV